MVNNNDSKHTLLRLIIEQGILHDSEAHPLVARDNKTRLQWVMNFLGISLNHDAMRLAAQETLKLLAHFKGRQLATIGTAAVPLLSACIMESGGKYSGLMVRSKRKAYGTASLIDGRINQNESVIIVDDSIGSGTNMLDCIDKLEAAGLHIEGCVCLVRFGYDSGYAALTERGYRVSFLFDQGRDISSLHANDWRQADYPIMDSFKQIVWDEQALPDYLSPFQAIRRSMAHFWSTGRLLKPPATFNQTLDTQGGLWLSLRAQDHLYTSQGRHGFWQLPDCKPISAPLAVSYVSWLFARHLQNDPHREQRLDNSALGLSLFGPLETCNPGDFDHRQHGLMARSTEAPWKMGGALPNMPGFHNETQILNHVRFNNTRLWRYEPYKLYKHTVRKLVEPGAEWPHGGVSDSEQPWDEQPGIIQPIAKQLFAWIKQIQRGEALSDAVKDLFIPAQCKWLFLSVYSQGKQLACMGNTPQNAADLKALVEITAQDQRWQPLKQQHTDLYIRVSLLSQSNYLGYATDLQQFGQFALGHNAVTIQHEQQFGIILPEMVTQYHWTARQLSEALYQKANITQQDQPAHWHSYRCRSWQVHAEQCYLLSSEQPLAPACQTTAELQRSSYLSFLNYHRQRNGRVNSHYYPGIHQVAQHDGLFSTAYTLWRLADMGTPLTDWQVSYQLLEQSLAEGKVGSTIITSVERAYSVLALLANPSLRVQQRPLIASQLDQLRLAFNHHGQLAKPTTTLETDFYSAEIQALLTARQQGFLIDETLLAKAVTRCLDYGGYQATPRQYPALLQTLALIKATYTEQNPDCAGQAGTLANKLISQLTGWQQSSGAFLAEHTGLPPTLFTVRALSALLMSGSLPDDFDVRLAAGLNYLKRQTLLPEQAYSVQSKEYSVGGIYSGMTNSSMDIIASAEMLWLLDQLDQQTQQ
ncbi:MAG: Orotate phosphoribosyltransferase [uncultured Thiotrichaceae bacterium]|uniref:Orotate phosphoribosyltransferase n=1 Tax=uncultured Thiotrichaceae bacterium TaxID=298394 RepID=A0A6S6TNU8_9GAMM|nr:MAG: Orotate phosphoribosyltransferase [uncultured Thiotrichaceae bacterium]